MVRFMRRRSLLVISTSSIFKAIGGLYWLLIILSRVLGARFLRTG